MTHDQAENLKRHLQRQVECDIEKERMKFERMRDEEARALRGLRLQIVRRRVELMYLRLMYCVTSPWWLGTYVFLAVVLTVLCLLLAASIPIVLIVFTVINLAEAALDRRVMDKLVKLEEQE